MARQQLPDLHARIHLPERGWSVELRPIDFLWTGRMLEGETAGRDEREVAAVLWTLVNRYFWGDGANEKIRATPRPASWRSFIQAFSQPINPAWSRGGARCTPGASGYSEVNCTESQLARRAMIQARSWRELPPVVRNYLARFARGETQHPPEVVGAIDFGSGSQNVSEDFRARRLPTPELRNAYYASRIDPETGQPGSLDYAGHFMKIYVLPVVRVPRATFGNLVPGIGRRIERILPQ